MFKSLLILSCFLIIIGCSGQTSVGISYGSSGKVTMLVSTTPEFSKMYTGTVDFWQRTSTGNVLVDELPIINPNQHGTRTLTVYRYDSITAEYSNFGGTQFQESFYPTDNDNAWVIGLNPEQSVVSCFKRK